jgi:hypothetical protein
VRTSWRAVAGRARLLDQPGPAIRPEVSTALAVPHDAMYGAPLALARPPARSPGMANYYHDLAGRYVAVDHLAMIIAVGRSECPS